MCIYKQSHLLFRAHIFPCDIPCNTPSIWVWQSSDTVGWGLGGFVGTFVVAIVVPVTGTSVVLSARIFSWDASTLKSRVRENDLKSVLFEIVSANFAYAFGEFWITSSSFACLFIFANISWYPGFFSNDKTTCVDTTNIKSKLRFIFPGAQIFCLLIICYVWHWPMNFR